MFNDISKAATQAVKSSKKRREIKVWRQYTYWIESDPAIQGDYLVECSPDGVKRPFSSEYTIGNSVHEYGGGDYAISEQGDIYFVRSLDQQIYHWSRQTKQIVLLTQHKNTVRYADLHVNGKILLAVRETHHTDQVENVIVRVNLSDLSEEVIAKGADFYASPRFSLNGKSWAYLSWDHPSMPWDECVLHVGSWGQDTMQIINQAAGEVISQFCWTLASQVVYTSDITGWANVYSANQPVCSIQKHFGFERWQQGGQNIGVTDDGTVIAIAGPPEQRQLGKIVEGEWVPFDLPCCDFTPDIAIHKENVVVQGAYKDRPPKILSINWQTGDWQVLEEDAILIPPSSVVPAEFIEFPTLDDKKAYAFFYDAQLLTQSSQKKPLLVLCHGGPTASTSPQWDPMIQFWVQQGFSVVDVNYRGSTGYGRVFQDALKYQWGKLDVEDCVAARDFLVEAGKAHPEQCFIRGKSSGGLTTLLALMWPSRFAAGACYYGVSDVEQLLTITHKFEQHYLDSLIGPYPQEKALYRKRSPAHQMDEIDTPVIFFHGEKDMVVPLDQTTAMVSKLKANNVSCDYHIFPDEKHGFKALKTKKEALVLECEFFKNVL